MSNKENTIQNSGFGSKKPMIGLKSESLAHQVASIIGRKIVTGSIQPGAPIPTEGKIQEEFSVSRTAVREGTRLLSAKGLVVSRPKIGTRVRPREEWNMLDSDVLTWHLEPTPSRGFIEHLMDMRDVIEPMAAKLAAERINEEQKAVLRVAINGIEINEPASAEQIEADLLFHHTIMLATHNPLLYSLGGMIEKSLAFQFSIAWNAVRKTPERSRKEHREVCDAILAGDGERAFKATKTLIQSTLHDVEEADIDQ